MENLIALESSLIIFLQSHLSDGIMKYFAFISDFADEIVVILVIGFLYWCYDKKFGLRILIYVCISATVFPMIKNLVCRIRPYMANSDIKCIKPAYEGDVNSIEVQGYSFPSGHTLNSVVIYGPIFKKFANIFIKVICAILIVSISIARFALGVHYPSDVLGGIILGLIVIFGYNFLIKRFSKNKIYIALLIICALGFVYCTSDDFFTGYGMLLGIALADNFENKYVKFDNTRNVLEVIVRMLGGLVLFLLLSKGLKLPFSEEFLLSKTFAAHIVRTVRYAILMFVSMGVYPMCFKFIKFNKKK